LTSNLARPVPAALAAGCHAECTAAKAAGTVSSSNSRLVF
jgi:hypothetical protein